MKIRTILAAAAIVFATACVEEQRHEPEQFGNAPKIVAELSDEPQTRTTIDSDSIVPGENVPVLWVPGDQLGVFSSGSANVLYTNDEQTENVPNASFSSSANVSGAIQYAYYPYNEANDGKAATELTGSIPAEQTMAAASYDPAADLMISKLLTLDIQPSNEAFEMEFQRLVAVGKITVNGIPAGEVMKSVEFAAEGVTLAGSIVADLVNAEIGEAKTSSNSVVVNTTNATSNEVYFTCMPATLETDTDYTIIVTTDKGAYIKNGTIGEKALKFVAGDVTGFKANMSTATTSEWQLVKNVEEL